jgi:hypothetical protein
MLPVRLDRITLFVAPGINTLPSTPRRDIFAATPPVRPGHLESALLQGLRVAAKREFLRRRPADLDESLPLGLFPDKRMGYLMESLSKPVLR